MDTWPLSLPYLPIISHNGVLVFSSNELSIVNPQRCIYNYSLFITIDKRISKQHALTNLYRHLFCILHIYLSTIRLALTHTHTLSLARSHALSHISSIHAYKSVSIITSPIASRLFTYSASIQNKIYTAFTQAQRQ